MPGAENFDEKHASDALGFHESLISTGMFDTMDPEKLAEISAGIALISDERPHHPITDEVVQKAGRLVQKVIPPKRGE